MIDLLTVSLRPLEKEHSNVYKDIAIFIRDFTVEKKIRLVIKIFVNKSFMLGL